MGNVRHMPLDGVRTFVVKVAVLHSRYSQVDDDDAAGRSAQPASV